MDLIQALLLTQACRLNLALLPSPVKLHLALRVVVIITVIILVLETVSLYSPRWSHHPLRDTVRVK